MEQEPKAPTNACGNCDREGIRLGASKNRNWRVWCAICGWQPEPGVVYNTREEAWAAWEGRSVENKQFEETQEIFCKLRGILGVPMGDGISALDHIQALVNAHTEKTGIITRVTAGLEQMKHDYVVSDTSSLKDYYRGHSEGVKTAVHFISKAFVEDKLSTVNDAREAEGMDRVVNEDKKDINLRVILGQMVRHAWLKWVKALPNPKQSWLVEWDGLPDKYKEADMVMGEQLFRQFEYQVTKLVDRNNRLRKALENLMAAQQDVEGETIEKFLRDIRHAIEEANKVLDADQGDKIMEALEQAYSQEGVRVMVGDMNFGKEQQNGKHGGDVDDHDVTCSCNRVGYCVCRRSGHT